MQLFAEHAAVRSRFIALHVWRRIIHITDELLPVNMYASFSMPDAIHLLRYIRPAGSDWSALNMVKVFLSVCILGYPLLQRIVCIFIPWLFVGLFIPYS